MAHDFHDVLLPFVTDMDGAGGDGVLDDILPEAVLRGTGFKQFKKVIFHHGHGVFSGCSLFVVYPGDFDGDGD
jgi:hypothetical protein